MDKNIGCVWVVSRFSREVGLRQRIGCPPFGGEWGVGIDVSLSMLSTILVDLIRLSRRLPFKDGGRDMTRVVTYDWWCVIRW